MPFLLINIQYIHLYSEMHTLDVHKFRFSTSFLAVSLLLWIGLRLNLPFWCILLHLLYIWSAIYFQCGYLVFTTLIQAYVRTCTYILLYSLIWGAYSYLRWYSFFLTFLFCWPSSLFGLSCWSYNVLAGSGVYSTSTVLKFNSHFDIRALSSVPVQIFRSK